MNVQNKNAPLAAGRAPVVPPSSPAGTSAAAAPSPSASKVAGAPAAPPPPSAAASVGDSHHPHPPTDGIINKTLFKCRKCKLLFWTTRDAASHERTCREAQWHNCSVCQVLRFRTREERAAHERTCGGPTPLRIADLPLADRVGNAAGGGAVISGRGSAGMVSAAAGVGSGQQKNNQQDVTKRIGSIIGTYRNQVRHGSSTTTTTTAASMAAPAAARFPSSDAAADGSGSDSSVEIIETSKPARPKSSSGKGANCGADSSVCKEVDHSKAPAKDGQKAPMEWTTVWTCDVCQKEQFDNYEEAVAHEKLCQAKKNRPKRPSQDPSPATKKGSEKKAVAAAPAKNTPTPSPTKLSPSKSSPSPKKLAASKPLTLFTPILKDSSDSANFSQISKYHRLILKSLRLLHLPPTSSAGGTVSFQCQFCSHPFTPDDDEAEGGKQKQQRWTLKTVAETLPSMVSAHATKCGAAPADVATQLPAAKSSGKMPFNEFLSGFFSENGVVERSADGRGVVVLSDEEFRNMPGAFSSKRGMQLEGSGSGKKKRGRPTGLKNPSASKRQKAVEPAGSKTPPRSKHGEIRYGDMGCKTHIEDGCQFHVGPLDGLPFLSSFSLQSGVLKELSRSEKFLLQQLELFTLSPKIAGVHVPPRLVGMRCRNCIADKNGCCYMRLSSVGDITRDLLLMATEHLVSCRFMKAKDLKVIQELQDGGSDRGTLTKYCNWMAKSYSLEAFKSGNPPGVVWGESPKVPAGGYCSPKDVKVSLLLGGNTPAPDLEAESSATTKEVGVKEVIVENKNSPDHMLLTHYHYLVLMEFVVVPSSCRGVSVNVSGRDSQGEVLTDLAGDLPMTASFKCKHCSQIVGMPTSLEHIDVFVSDSISHAESCPKIPPTKKKELENHKATLTLSGTERCIRYLKELCARVYKMADIRDPGTGTSFVGFSNVEELKAKYGKKHAGGSGGNGDDTNKSDEVFSLPMIEQLF